MPALDYLDEEQREAVHALATAATTADGIPPLSEHVALHLRDGGDAEDLHFLSFIDDQLAGYAHLDLTDHVDGPSAEVVVHPSYRGRGVGRTLMQQVITVAGPRLRLWSHGDLPVAARLAGALGFQRIRTLIQMRRPLTLPLPEKPIITRPFRVGVDEQAWLDLNTRVFAEHPEQGQWSRVDLDRRIREAWFDPSGFLIHERAHQLAGFCWTKVHGHRPHGPEAHPHGHDVIGEIYVVGVDPAFRGDGLGRALTIAGLRYLQQSDVTAAMLYVDASNANAIALYTSLGFTEWGRDVMYRAPASLASAQTKN